MRRQWCARARAAGVAAVVPLLVAVALLAGAARSLPAQDDEREAPEVKALVIRGVHAVEKSELEKSIATQASGCKGLLFIPLCAINKSHLWYARKYLDRTEFKRDLLRIKVFYWKRGYRNADVDSTVTRQGDGVRVAFNIKEGPPTRVSSIVVSDSGHRILSRRDITKAMQIRAGQPLNIIALDSSRVLLRSALLDKGYGDALVTVDTGYPLVDTARKAASIHLTLTPRWLTRVGAIDIRGREKISQSTIRRSLSFKEGSIFRQSDVLASQRNLYESNLFRGVQIVIPPEGDSLKTIVITLREAPLRESRTSVGFNTVDFLQAEERFTRYNFFGGARRLDLTATFGNLLAQQLNGTFPFQDVTPTRLTGGEETKFLRPTWKLSADLTQPWVGSVRNSAGVSVFAHRTSAPGIFIDHGYGTSVAFTRQLGYKSPMTLNYRFELTRIEAGDVYFCVNFGVCEQQTIGVLRGNPHLSPLSLSFFTDRSNDLFNPSAGYIARADMEHASSVTASDFHYNRASGEGTKYFRVSRKMTLATRLRAGILRALGSQGTGLGVGLDSSAILHPRKRFYAGGANSVRGYGENQLGPRVLTVDPAILKDANRGDKACTDETILDGSCDPNGTPDDRYSPVPTGGSSLLEGNVELRFPIWKQVGMALFLDGAFVGQGPFRTITSGTGALTPGFGFRYLSPAGAIRVDLGFRPRLAEKLSVVTQVPDPVTGRPRIVPLAIQNEYDPLGSSGGFRRFLDRLQLHLSIGQAF